MTDLWEVPENARRCKTCGWVIVPKKDDPERDLCFCCEHGIPLFPAEEKKEDGEPPG